MGAGAHVDFEVEGFFLTRRQGEVGQADAGVDGEGVVRVALFRLNGDGLALGPEASGRQFAFGQGVGDQGGVVLAVHAAPEQLGEGFFESGQGRPELHAEEPGAVEPSGVLLVGFTIGVPADRDRFLAGLERAGGAGVERPGGGMGAGAVVFERDRQFPEESFAGTLGDRGPGFADDEAVGGGAFVDDRGFSGGRFELVGLGFDAAGDGREGADGGDAVFVEGGRAAAGEPLGRQGDGFDAAADVREDVIDTVIGNRHGLFGHGGCCGSRGSRGGVGCAGGRGGGLHDLRAGNRPRLVPRGVPEPGDQSGGAEGDDNPGGTVHGDEK